MHIIASDITGDVSVNYYRTQEMDEEIQTDMAGKTVVQHSLKTKAQICHLSNTNTIKIRDEVIHMDSQLLFKIPVAAVQGADKRRGPSH